MFHIQTQEILIASQDNIYIINNRRIQDRLILYIADQFFCMLHRRNQFIRQFSQKNLCIRQIVRRFSLQDIPQF